MCLWLCYIRRLTHWDLNKMAFYRSFWKVNIIKTKRLIRVPVINIVSPDIPTLSLKATNVPIEDYKHHTYEGLYAAKWESNLFFHVISHIEKILHYVKLNSLRHYQCQSKRTIWVVTWQQLTKNCQRHGMKKSKAVSTSSSGNIFRVTGHLCRQRPVTRSLDVFFDLRLNKRLSKQWWGCSFETPSRPLWRHYNEQKRKHILQTESYHDVDFVITA